VKSEQVIAQRVGEQVQEFDLIACANPLIHLHLQDGGEASFMLETLNIDAGLRRPSRRDTGQHPSGVRQQ